MSKNTKKEQMNSEDVLRRFQVIIRYFSSGISSIHSEKEKIILALEKIGGMLAECGCANEAKECIQMACEYKNTSRYRDEVEQILENDENRFFEYHYKFAYENLIKEYLEEGNMKKVDEYREKLSLLEQ